MATSNHVHYWEPAAWDKRFEKCRGCPAARLTAEEANRQREAAYAAAEKRQAEGLAQRKQEA
jgi:hypothetical protein